MKASEANLLQFLQKLGQFVIPIYQRNYSWTLEQCRQLWGDLMRAGQDEKIKSHFIGSIVYIDQSQSTVMAQEPRLVIDGQQRLTTVTLLIAALAEHLESHHYGQVPNVFTADQLRNLYLFNQYEQGERHFKLLLSETDKHTLLAILKNTPLPQPASLRVQENHKFFSEKIFHHKDELVAICIGLAKLFIVEVALDRAHDNPQLIFESMNSTGLELSQADLIRNYILMSLAPKLQTELYKNYWRPMEQAFGQAGYEEHFDAFMRHYLTTKTGEIPKLRDVYAAFKSYATKRGTTMQELVAEIHTYAVHYCAMVLGAEADKDLKQALHDLRELKVDVAYPFLLGLYEDRRTGLLTTTEVQTIVRLVESYVFRRAICAIPTNSLNKTFASLAAVLEKGDYVKSVKAEFQLMPSYRRFPTDDEFTQELKRRDLYNFRSRSYWLRRLENHGRKEPVNVSEYTIEHILPQNEDLSAEWRAELGEHWQSIQKQWLHTLGNLTLTGYNSHYSDRPFAYKRDQVKDNAGDPIGFAHSPLHLNQGLGQIGTWGTAAIGQRANRLADIALKAWPAPDLDAAALAAYRAAKAKPAQGWSLADHAQLAGGPVRDLFDALRNEVLALDACVNEEFLKLYIAYKAETNFVDVIPQAKRLRLILNMPFADIDDPKELCRDVTGLGRWGNGDVEVGLQTADELPYVMSLVRQAFERQMSTQTLL